MADSIRARVAIDRDEVIWEIEPGVTNAIETAIEEGGGLVCEQHPEREWPHGDCAGPGMIRADA